MIKVLSGSWALLLGMFLLMIGNGLQGSLVGVRGGIEGFSTAELSVVMSGYFAGFLGGSRATPHLIRRVGHVRVFAALGSLISAVLILYPTLTNPVAWTLLRVVMGFCFSGVYVVAESWMNDSATNETRGQSLSLYMTVQMAGIVAAQGILTLGDPSGFVLFIVPSVLVSIAFAPILLTVSPTPAFETSQPMGIRRLFALSPLSCVGCFLLGGVYSATFGMAAVYGSRAGLSIVQISAFLAAIYLGGLILQFPIGWLSDRLDRRMLILNVALLGGAAAIVAALAGGVFWMLLLASFVIGGTTNPLYALMIAHTNDFLDTEDMAAASGGMIFLNGVGAVAGPLVTAPFMVWVGPPGFFIFILVLLSAIGAYAAYRTTRRAAPDVADTGQFAPVLQSSTAVAVETAREVYLEGVDEVEPDTT
ncbi:major facilitator transporter [Actibacterium mucosum KCTC 23349]|uniref:Major facilitator transporter n=1 Tax=Actibacterium mucosum KCTC 23349 TaxID=1454373 RepID=A0A037ZI52_9RHOB|nr:MFS transporter [Actibacterium mucosum]KAJ54475.1 major facilitator transporter [Actibacterium mucosum KCTC 23349]